MTLSGLSRSLGIFGALFLSVIFAACGPEKKDPGPKTLAQISDEFSSTSYHICRLNFSYELNEKTPIGAYIAVSGMDRDLLKKQILDSCVQLPAEQSSACGAPDVFESARCTNVDALAHFISPEKKDEAGSVFECWFRSNWHFQGKAYKNYETFRMKSAEKKSDAIKALIEECMSLPPLEREGCTGALVTGNLRCNQKPAQP